MQVIVVSCYTGTMEGRSNMETTYVAAVCSTFEDGDVQYFFKGSKDECQNKAEKMANLLGTQVMTKEQLAGVLGFFSALFSQNPQTTLLSLTAEEDRVVLEKTARDGLTPGGARYGNDYLMLFRLREGMIVEIREYYDPRKVEPLYSEMQANQPGNQA